MTADFKTDDESYQFVQNYGWFCPVDFSVADLGWV